RWRVGRLRDALLPESAGTIGPDVDFADFTDDAGLNPFVRESRAFAGVTLIAHLRHDAGFVSRLRQRAAFVERMREGLLAVDVLAGLDGGHRGRGVNVVGGPDSDGVDVLGFLVHHLAKVFVLSRLWELFEDAGGSFFIDVAESDDVGAQLGVGRNVSAAHA